VEYVNSCKILYSVNVVDINDIRSCRSAFGQFLGILWAGCLGSVAFILAKVDCRTSQMCPLCDADTIQKT